MSHPADILLTAQRFDALPQSVEEAEAFLKAKGFKTSVAQRADMERAIDKLRHNQPLSADESQVFHQVVDLGDTCGCDNDHRMRGKSYFNDEREVGYART